MRRPTGTANIEAIRAYVVDLRAVKAQLLGEAEQAESMARLGAAVAEAMKAATAAQQERNSAAQARAERSATATAEALKKRVERLQGLLGRLPLSTAEADRRAAEALAEQALSADSEGQARGCEMELRARIQDVQKRENAKLREAERAGALMADLAGFSEPEVLRLVGRLRSIAEGHERMTERLEAEARAAHSRAKAVADREYAAEVLREEFATLGYSVGEEFTTAFVQGGSILVSRSDHAPHSVALHFDPHATTIDSEVVRRFKNGTSEADPIAGDAQAEEAWCADFGKVLSGAWHRQVQARVVRRQRPGAAPVRSIETADTPALTESLSARAEASKAETSKRPRRRLQARQL